MKKTFAFTLLALAAGMTAYAQLPVAPPPHEAGKGATPTAPGAPKKEEPKETPRMSRLKSLSFDRRPSSILKAWAPQPEPKKDDTPKEPAAKSPEAKEPDPKAAEQAAALDKEIAAFQKHVTLGKWADVKVYLVSLPADEG